ncbi:MAG: methyl-coenzyme M reductase subunit alpha, partial [Methanosarcinales archaeon]
MPYNDIQHSFMKAMSDKFAEKPEGTTTEFYTYGGIAQKGGMRKREFIAEASKIVDSRVNSTPAYNPDAGMPQGQRYLMPYMMNHTDIMVNADDLHWINNAAMQQCWDDMKRGIVL